MQFFTPPPRFFKSVLTIILFSFCSTFIFFSCEKENELVKQNELEPQTTESLSSFNQSSNLVSSRLAGVTNQDGILRFEDWIHFEDVVERLKAAQENHLYSFEEIYQGLTNEELDAKEEEIGFIYYQPLINFEDELNFSSLRAKVELEILDWLDNSNLDMSASPNRRHSHSVEVRTLLNEEYEVKIGNEVISLFPLDNYDKENTPSKMMDDCFRWKKRFFDDQYNSGNNKYEAFLEHDSWPFVLKAHAEITNFKRKSNGKWKRARADLYVDVEGRIYDSECRYEGLNYFKKDSKKRKSLDVRIHQWSGQHLKGKENKVLSNYEVGDISGVLILN